MNKKANYYSPVGSYDGVVKWQGSWIRVSGLNRINKNGWTRWQGPPSKAICKAMRYQYSIRVDLLFPELSI